MIKMFKDVVDFESLETKEKGFILTKLYAGEFFGAIANLSNKVYHTLSHYVSSTSLKNILKKSPKHYKYELDHPSDKKSDGMILGSAFHARLLTPSVWEDEFFITKKMDLRTKEGKHQKALADIEAVRNKKICIDELLASDAFRMADEVWKHQAAAKLLSESQKEISFFWKCPYSSLLMRAKVDAMTASYMIEVKSASSANPTEFSRQAFNLNYDLSLVHYRNGINAIFNMEIPAYFIVTENTSPYVTEVFEASPNWFETGHKKWLDAVDKMSRGLQANDWPSYGPKDEIILLNPPIWAFKNTEVNDDGI